MKGHTFVNISSPPVAINGLKHTVQHGEAGQTKDIVKRDFYVDDGLQSLLSVNKVINLLSPHKIPFNNPAVKQAFPSADYSKCVCAQYSIGEN